MPATSTHPSSAPALPIAVLLSVEGDPPPHAARLTRAGFDVQLCKNAADALRLSHGAALCDASLLEDADLSQRSMEQLVRARLVTLLDRLGEEPVAGLYTLVMREVERGLLTLVLERCRGHKGHAAEQLGLHRNTLRQKVAELGLEGSRPKRAKARARR